MRKFSFGPWRALVWVAAIACGLALGLSAAPSIAGVGKTAVVATVGNHQITEGDVDARVGSQVTALESRIFELKSNAIESIADDYLLTGAAKKANLSIGEYIDKTLGPAKKVTSADAKAYYDAHKAHLPRVAFAKIEQPLIQALQKQRESVRRQQVLAKLRTKTPVRSRLKPPRVKVALAADAPSLGPRDAPVTVVEFGDFQCPFCKAAESSLEILRAKYGNQMRLVYLDFPLPIHAHAMTAAQAARCAGEQGRFWPYHDALFANQSKLAPADLRALARALKLDSGKFDQCLDSGKYAAAIREDIAEGTSLGVTGTPTFFINGRPLTGAQPPSYFESVIDQELARARTEKTAAR